MANLITAEQEDGVFAPGDAATKAELVVATMLGWTIQRGASRAPGQAASDVQDVVDYVLAALERGRSQATGQKEVGAEA